MDMNLFKDLKSIMEDDSIQEPTPDVETDMEGETPEAPVVTELTEEEITELAELVGVLPEQMDEFKKGVVVEMEHIETADGNKEIVAKIALDHIKETPAEKSYYDALEQMEHELQETPEEEAAEGGAEIPAGEGAPVDAAMEGKIPANPTEVDKEGKTEQTLREEAVPVKDVVDINK